MPRILVALAALFLLSTYGQAQSDTRLMSTGDYQVFLAKVSLALPRWEATVNAIDPEKAPTEMPYTYGKMIAKNREIGLLELSYIRFSMAQLRAKP